MKKNNKRCGALILVVLLAILCVGLSAMTSVTAEEPTEPSVTLVGACLQLDNNVYIVYYATAEGADPADIRMDFWTEEAYLAGSDPILTLSESEPDRIGDEVYRAFVYKNLNARQMTSVIYARAYVTVEDETYFSDTAKYSILQYAYNMRRKACDNVKLMKLLDEMLEYGTAAQEFFGENLDDLATADHYTVSVSGGSLADGMTWGLFPEGKSVSVTTDDAHFCHWKDSAGNKIGFNSVLTLMVEGEETLTAVSHDYEAIVTPPTCTEDGYTTHTCDGCGDSYVDTPTSATGHHYTQEVIDAQYLATPATCTEAATYYYSCTCGEKGSETFAYGGALGHTFTDQVIDDDYLASPADHNNAATYYYSCFCGECGTETFEYGDPIPHTFDKRTVSEEYLASAATCTASATYYYSCECGAHGTETFPYGDPIPHTFNQKVVSAAYLATPATHEVAATYYYSCACGERGAETFSFGKPIAHVYDRQVVSDEYLALPATHDSPARYYYSCECGAKGIETFTYGDPIPHIFDYMIIDDVYLASAATCTAPATYYYSCECGAKGTETFTYGDPISHTFDQQVIDDAYLVSAATHDAPAVYYYSCTCGECGTETFTYGSPIPHTFDRQVIDEIYLVSSATHDSPARYYYSCECGAHGTETFTYGSSIPHVFDRMIIDPAYLASEATVISPARYYYSCECGAHGTETFTYGDPIASSDGIRIANGRVPVAVRGATYSFLDYDIIQTTTACGHSDILTVVIAPTCLAQGYTAHTCADCGYFYCDSYTDALGHNFVDGECTRCHIKVFAEETFDGASVVGGSYQYSSVETEEKGGVDNQYAHIPFIGTATGSGTNGSGNYDKMMRINNEELSYETGGIVVFEAKYRPHFVGLSKDPRANNYCGYDYTAETPTNPSVEAQFLTVRDGNGTTRNWITLYMIDLCTGNLLYMGQAVEGAQPLVADEWNTVKLVIDLAAGTYTTYVNGALYARNGYISSNNDDIGLRDVTVDANKVLVAKCNKCVGAYLHPDLADGRDFSYCDVDDILIYSGSAN